MGGSTARVQKAAAKSLRASGLGTFLHKSKKALDERAHEGSRCQGKAQSFATVQIHADKRRNLGCCVK
eukprot:878009-Karenia_brevis.AAC.1